MREYRDYFRPEAAASQPWLGLSSLTHFLIVANVAAFAAIVLIVHGAAPLLAVDPQRISRALVDALGLTPRLVLEESRVWQLLTYGFVHAPGLPDALHLLVSLTALRFFGRELETLYGPRRFLSLYLLAIVTAGALYTFAGRGGGALTGATGAAFAMMAVYALHYPRQRVLALFLVTLEVRWLVLGLVALDLAFELGGAGSGRTQHLAHLAGAGAGVLFWRFQSTVQAVLERFERRAVRADRESHEEIEARLDTLLEKISREGVDALSRAEREFLQRASLHYQRKQPT